jgi:hypothetical protein
MTSRHFTYLRWRNRFGTSSLTHGESIVASDSSVLSDFVEIDGNENLRRLDEAFKGVGNPESFTKTLGYSVAFDSVSDSVRDGDNTNATFLGGVCS